jgi:hypothetical protein
MSPEGIRRASEKAIGPPASGKAIPRAIASSAAGPSSKPSGSIITEESKRFFLKKEAKTSAV